MIIFTLLITTFYIGFIWWLVRSDDPPRQQHAQADVTVIIPVRNGSQFLKECVHRVMQNKGVAQVLVVNDGSPEALTPILTEWEQLGVRVIPNQGLGKKQAILSALKEVTTPWVLLTDVDTQAGQHWVSQMFTYTAPTVDVVLGPVTIAPHRHVQDGFQYLEFQGLQGATRGAANRGYPISANGANMLVRTSVFYDLAPYETNLDRPTGDDVFLMNAVWASGRKVVYASHKDATVATYPAPTWKDIWWQRVRWASKSDAVIGVNQKIMGATVVVANAWWICIAVFTMVTGWQWASWFLLFKWYADYTLIRYMQPVLGGQVKIAHFMISALAYPVLVVASIVGGVRFRKSTR